MLAVVFGLLAQAATIETRPITATMRPSREIAEFVAIRNSLSTITDSMLFVPTLWLSTGSNLWLKISIRPI
jgi:hypothetical protein